MASRASVSILVVVASVLLFRFPRSIAAALNITSVIGGYNNGAQAVDVAIRAPKAVCVDSENRLLFVTDDKHLVWTVNLTSGTATIVAGTGAQLGLGVGDGGPATSATLLEPGGLALRQRNLYIVDTANNKLRVVNLTSGIISLVVGTFGGSTAENVSMATADASGIRNIAIGNAGELYLSIGNRIREALSSGAIVTLAGNTSCRDGPVGEGTPAGQSAMCGVTGLSYDSVTGALYLADSDNNKIKKVIGTPGAEVVHVVAGTTSGGTLADWVPATTASLAGPTGVLVLPGGDIVFSETLSHCVRRIFANGSIYTVAGTRTATFFGDGGPARNAGLYRPSGLAYDVSTSVLYVADTLNHRVRSIDAFGIINTVAGNGYATATRYPCHVSQMLLFSALDIKFVPGTGTIYVVDSNSVAVRIFPNGTATVAAGQLGASGYTQSGGPATSTRLSTPSGIDVDSETGTLYIADPNNNKVHAVWSNGTITLVAGTGIPGYSGDGGLARLAALARPYDVAWHASSTALYIADSSNHRIRVVDALGTIHTVAGDGTGGTSNWVTGFGLNVTLNAPSGLALDSITETLYIAERIAARVRYLVLRNGTIGTLAGGGNAVTTGANVPISALEYKFACSINVVYDPVARSVLVVDVNDRIVLRVAEGFVSRHVGTSAGGIFDSTGDGGSALLATFAEPQAAAIDPSTGAVLIIDGRSDRMRLAYPPDAWLTVNAVTSTIGGAVASFAVITLTGTGFFAVDRIKVAGQPCSHITHTNWTHMTALCPVAFMWDVNITSPYASAFTAFTLPYELPPNMPIPPLTISSSQTLSWGSGLVLSGSALTDALPTALTLFDTNRTFGYTCEVDIPLRGMAVCLIHVVAEALFTSLIGGTMEFGLRSPQPIPSTAWALRFVRPSVSLSSVPILVAGGGVSSIVATLPQALPSTTQMLSVAFPVVDIFKRDVRCWIDATPTHCIVPNGDSDVVIQVPAWSVAAPPPFLQRVVIEVCGLFNATSDGLAPHAALNTTAASTGYLVVPRWASIHPSLMPLELPPLRLNVTLHGSGFNYLDGMVEELSLRCSDLLFACPSYQLLNDSALLCADLPFATMSQILQQFPTVAAWNFTVLAQSRGVLVSTALVLTVVRQPEVHAVVPPTASLGSRIAVLGSFLYPSYTPSSVWLGRGTVQCLNVTAESEDWVACSLPNDIPVSTPDYPTLGVSILTPTGRWTNESATVSIPIAISAVWSDAHLQMNVTVNHASVTVHASAWPSGSDLSFPAAPAWAVTVSGIPPLSCWLAVAARGGSENDLCEHVDLEEEGDASVSALTAVFPASESTVGDSNLDAGNSDNTTAQLVFSSVGVQGASGCVVAVFATCRDALGQLGTTIPRNVLLSKLSLQWLSAALVVVPPAEVPAAALLARVTLSTPMAFSEAQLQPEVDVSTQLACTLGINEDASISIALPLTAGMFIASTTSVAPVNSSTTSTNSTAVFHAPFLSASECALGRSYYLHAECVWSASGERLRLPTRRISIINVTVERSMEGNVSDTANTNATSLGPVQFTPPGFQAFPLPMAMVTTPSISMLDSAARCTFALVNTSTARLAPASLAEVFSVVANGTLTPTPRPILQGQPGQEAWIYMVCSAWGKTITSAPVQVQIANYTLHSNASGLHVSVWPSSSDTRALHPYPALAISGFAVLSFTCSLSLAGVTCPLDNGVSEGRPLALVPAIQGSIVGESSQSVSVPAGNAQAVSVTFGSFGIRASLSCNATILASCRDGAGRSATIVAAAVTLASLVAEWGTDTPADSLSDWPLSDLPTLTATLSSTILPPASVLATVAALGRPMTFADGSLLAAWWSCSTGIWEAGDVLSADLPVDFSSARNSAVGSVVIAAGSWQALFQGLSCVSCHVGTSYAVIAECTYKPNGQRVRLPQLSLYTLSVIPQLSIANNTVVNAFEWQTANVTLAVPRGDITGVADAACSLAVVAQSATLTLRTDALTYFVRLNTSAPIRWMLQGQPLQSLSVELACLVWGVETVSTIPVTLSSTAFVVSFDTTNLSQPLAALPSSNDAIYPLSSAIKLWAPVSGEVACTLSIGLSSSSCATGSASLVMSDTTVSASSAEETASIMLLQFTPVAVAAPSGCTLLLSATCVDAIGRVNSTHESIQVNTLSWAQEWRPPTVQLVSGGLPPGLIPPLIAALVVSPAILSGNSSSEWSCVALLMPNSTVLTPVTTFQTLQRTALSSSVGSVVVADGEGWNVTYSSLTAASCVLATTYLVTAECTWAPTGERVRSAVLQLTTPTVHADWVNSELAIRAYTTILAGIQLSGLRPANALIALPHAAATCSLSQVPGTANSRAQVVASPWAEITNDTDAGVAAISFSVESSIPVSLQLQLLCRAWGQPFASPTLTVHTSSYQITNMSAPTRFVPVDTSHSWATPDVVSLQVVDDAHAPVFDAACSLALAESSSGGSVQLVPLDRASLTGVIPSHIAATVSFPPFGIFTALPTGNGPSPNVSLLVSCARATGETAPSQTFVVSPIRIHQVTCTQPSLSAQSQVPMPPIVVGFSSAMPSPSGQPHTCSTLATDLPLPGFLACVIVPAGLSAGDDTIFLQGATAALDVDTLTATFSQFIITAPRGFTYTFAINCSLGSVTIPGSTTFHVAVEGCGVGTVPSGVFCNTCGDGSFSEGGQRSQCVPCPPLGAVCKAGLLQLLPNYFRPPSQASLPFDLNTELHPCLNGEACVVNASTLSYSCLRGYTGPLCSVCDTAIDFARFTDACRPCWSSTTSQALVGLACLAILALLTAVALRKSTSRSEPSIVLRIGMSYLQAVGSLRVLKSGGTSAYRSIMGFTDAISASPLSVSALQCIWRPPYLLQFAVTISLPVLAALAVVLIFIVATLARACCSAHTAPTDSPSSSNSNLRGTAAQSAHSTGMHTDRMAGPSTHITSGHGYVHTLRSAYGTFAQAVSAWWSERRHLATLVFVLFLAYMPITSSCLKALDCYSPPIDGVRYLRGDMSIECYVGQHAVARVLAFSALALVGLGYPLGLFILFITAKPSVVRSERFHATWGFMYDGYRGGEVAVVPRQLRKSLLVAMGSSTSAGGGGRNSVLSSYHQPQAGPATSGSSSQELEMRSEEAGGCRVCASRILRVTAVLRDALTSRLLWWESVVLLRKAGIVVFAVVVTNPYAQVVGASLWLFLFFALQLRLQPYTKRLFNILETWSLGAALSTAVISSSLLQFEVEDPAFISQPAASMTPLQWLITAALLIINISTIILLVGTWLFLQGQRAKKAVAKVNLVQRFGTSQRFRLGAASSARWSKPNGAIHASSAAGAGPAATTLQTTPSDGAASGGGESKALWATPSPKSSARSISGKFAMEAIVGSPMRHQHSSRRAFAAVPTGQATGTCLPAASSATTELRYVNPLRGASTPPANTPARTTTVSKGRRALAVEDLESQAALPLGSKLIESPSPCSGGATAADAVSAHAARGSGTCDGANTGTFCVGGAALPAATGNASGVAPHTDSHDAVPAVPGEVCAPLRTRDTSGSISVVPQARLAVTATPRTSFVGLTPLAVGQLARPNSRRKAAEALR